MRWSTILAMLLTLPLLLWGCLNTGPPADDDDDDDTSDDDDTGDDDGGDDDGGDDDGGDDDGGDDDTDDCANYRQTWPGGPYGTSVGSVLDDWPGMQDASGTSVSLQDVYGDTSKVALVVANAFDT